MPKWFKRQNPHADCQLCPEHPGHSGWHKKLIDGYLHQWNDAHDKIQVDWVGEEADPSDYLVPASLALAPEADQPDLDKPTFPGFN